jgi:hypothetical protein
MMQRTLRLAAAMLAAGTGLALSSRAQPQVQAQPPSVGPMAPSLRPCAAPGTAAAQGADGASKAVRQHPQDECAGEDAHRRDVHTNPEKSKVIDVVRVEITNLGTCPVEVSGVNEDGETNSMVGDPPVRGETESVESGTIRATQGNTVQAVCTRPKGDTRLCKYEVRVMSVRSIDIR